MRALMSPTPTAPRALPDVALETRTDHGGPLAAVGMQQIEMPVLLRLADGTTNKLFGEPNDLVVHVAGMTLIDPQIGAYIKERLDYGANGQVHHCAYFSQNRTALSLGQWLIDTLT